MTQIRRVTRSTEMNRSARPDAASGAPADHAEAAARLATVTSLFPAHPMSGQPRTDNIFADLAEDNCGPASRARARAARLLATDGIPSIDNIFAEECPDLGAEDEALMQARLASRPRKMALARAEIMAAHDERAAAMRPFANHELPRIAAGLAAVVTVLSLLQLPHA